MIKYNKRVQILFSKEQHDFLKSISKQRQQSIAQTIRFAVDSTFRPSSSIKEIQAYNKLISLNLIQNDLIQKS